MSEWTRNTHLEVVDVDIEASSWSVGNWTCERLISSTQHAGLLIHIAIGIALFSHLAKGQYQYSTEAEMLADPTYWDIGGWSS